MEEPLEDFLRTTGALYDKTRVELLKFIEQNGTMCVCDLQNSFGMLQSRLSRHLKILKDAEFLALRKEGRWRYYSIRIPLDRFRAQAIEETKTLPITIPNLKRHSYMKIEILGTGCSKCKALEKNVLEAIAKSGKFAQVKKVEELTKIVAYGVVSTPGLVIDSKVVSTGKLLTVDEITKLI